MCGRYALDENARQLADHFQLVAVPEFPPRFNIAPGTPVLAIRDGPDGRIGEFMAWGFSPAWSQRPGAKDYPRPINARSETVDEKPMFRKAFRTRRCVLPASGFFEWRRPDHGPKQPYYFTPTDEPLFSMAGIFEPSHDGSAPTCCILTTGANAVMAPIHDRMPVMIARTALDAWLDPATPAASLAGMLMAPRPESIRAWPVSTRVNAARNDSRDLVEPVGDQPE